MVVNETKIKVRYAETDQMGVVYHGNYLVWFEIGRTSLIEQLGFSYAALERDGVVAPVVDVNVQYKKPVRYGETAVIKSWIHTYDGFRTRYCYEVYKENGELAAKGYTDHICVDKTTFRPIRFGRKFPDWDKAYNEAKEQ